LLRCGVMQVAAFALLGALGTRSAASADVLYIGDGGDNTVKRFDASSGHPLQGNPFVTGLHGPRGLLFDGSTATPRLLVVNQNVALNIPGEVLQYDGDTGAPLGALVASTDKDAPLRLGAPSLAPTWSCMLRL
jgi:hypothetical protein